jgi:hypothetical protein
VNKRTGEEGLVTGDRFIYEQESDDTWRDRVAGYDPDLGIPEGSPEGEGMDVDGLLALLTKDEVEARFGWVNKTEGERKNSCQT